MTKSIGACVLAVLSLWALDAGAQSKADAARADELFREGKALLEAGKAAEACPKLAESLRLDRAGGTLLAIALCHEAVGKSASAWREFTEAAVSADRAGRGDRSGLAHKHLSALEPTLSKLTITVPDDIAKMPGLAIERDGEPVPRSDYNHVVPIDPGDHVVAARAAGSKPWSTQVRVGPTRDSEVVTVPTPEMQRSVEAAPLASSSSEPVPPPSTPAATDSVRSSTARTEGYVIGAMGIASLAIGGFFGVRAVEESHDAKSMCPTVPLCTNPSAITTNSQAKTSAWISDAALGLGLVGVAVGAYLVLHVPHAPGGQASTLRLGPRIAPQLGSLSLDGDF